MTSYRIRPASVADAGIILRFIRELADYEKALHEVAATEETVAASLFGEGSVSRALICETETGEPAGSAVFFNTYSTWQAKNGLYLEDLYVTPDHRGSGVGKMLLRALAASPSMKVAAASNGACSTGTRLPSASMTRSAPSPTANGSAIAFPARS